MKSIFNWSGGKDSSLALYKVLQSETIVVGALLTSVNEKLNRIAMHGVRVDLLETQAKSIALPLIKMLMPEMPSMEAYEKTMRTTWTQLKEQGFDTSIFGDIFLEDLKKYREDKSKEMGITCHFPLWKQSSEKLMSEFFQLGFKAVVVCVNDQYLDQSFCGRLLDESFVSDLPSGVDVCGENGEYHSFVFDGPIFNEPICFTKGEMVYRKYSSSRRDDDDGYNCNRDAAPFSPGFWYCDLIPGKYES